MPNAFPDPLVQSILLNEKRKASARAILNRPASSVPMALLALALAGLLSYLFSRETIDAPPWLVALCTAGFILSVLNAVDAWSTRRRLEAAITLLQLQQEVDR